MKLSPTEIFRGKNIFFIGGTGFLGKVTLSMLLHNFPDVGKVYATVRAREENESNSRFWKTNRSWDISQEKTNSSELNLTSIVRSKIAHVYLSKQDRKPMTRFRSPNFAKPPASVSWKRVAIRTTKPNSNLPSFASAKCGYA